MDDDIDSGDGADEALLVPYIAEEESHGGAPKSVFFSHFGLLELVSGVYNEPCGLVIL